MKNTTCCIAEENNRISLENGGESALVQFKKIGDRYLIARSHLVNTGNKLCHLTSGLTKNNYFIEICEEL